ncbi:B12-binding domain-containing radical SAM protein [Bacillus horti]|uniref:Anaerobic magnesium-protoporphyrin IX monomethyl ester cyclase n=1 Tax=Caldalkalibacillus horti TaxID=77523 RepID=A0ABT9VY80_9BACI|nr:B12-binding domain-containing radical SAM protein [Bacillus horti]MDQ0165782.1 anaerobic magnesium-protoporphyrin IX monomethyl ester cyclase [Bacillus horti]
MNVVVSTLNAKYIHTCLALRYLKSYAEPEFPIQMKEYTIKDPVMNIVSDLYSLKPDVIGFSCYIWNIEQTLPIISMLKKVLPQVKIILGGPEVSYDVSYWMERTNDIDFIVVGEGEETFKHLLAELQGEQKYHLVFGLAYRSRTGETIVNPPRPKLDLTTLPSPFRFNEDLEDLSKRIVYIETSRGCPFSCQFCLSSIEVGVRYFDIEQMKKEILFLIANGAKLIKFVDRTFNIKRDYALEMFQFLIDHHQGCVFQFEITADIMRPEVIEFLNEHAPEGIFRFEIGVQSTNDFTNELVKRKQNFSKLSRTVTLVREGKKITQHLDLIAGLPEEDYDSFKKTFNDVYDLEPEELQLGFLKMLRGTGVRLQAEKHDYVFMDHAPYEILSNNVLSFSDMVRIKQVEDILEKYWNAHRMDQTIKYLTSYTFPTPFDFFQQFGTYWEEQGWSKIGHQLEDLFQRLHQFLVEQSVQDIEIIESLMKYDFFIHHKYKPRKVWWNSSLDKSERAKLLHAVSESPTLISESFAQLGLREQELHKHVMLDRVVFDLDTYFDTGVVLRKPTYLFVYFDPTETKALPFTSSQMI